MVDLLAATRGAVARHGAGDLIFAALTWLFAVLVLMMLGGVLVSLLHGSMLALKTFGLNFYFTEEWNPVTERYGAVVPIFGTVVTATIAMLVGIPLSFGIAFFLTELCPHWLRRPVGMAIELLAAIPSIIYGIWGLFVLAPLLQHYAQPFVNHLFSPIPILGALFSGPPLGIGMGTAGVILGIMVLPFITSIMRDVFETAPVFLRESAYGLGATRWEVVWNVVLPYSRIGVVGGIMLGLGRALGETMAVTFVIGNSHSLSASLNAPGTTIASALANEFTEAVSDLYSSSLVALGLVLFVITFSVLGIAKYLLMRAQRRYAGS